MSYNRTEYRSDSDRHDDDKQGGWRSWFGLGGNKDDNNDRDRGYSYTNTTTYRGDDSNRYGFSGDRMSGPSGYSGAISGGYSGSRGGYGYTTSDDYNRGNTNYSRSNDNSNYNRDNSSRGGDRDVYYRQETRTYPTTGYTGSSNYTSGNYGSYGTPSYGTPSYGTQSFGPQSFGPSYGNTDRDYTVSRTTTNYNTDRDYRPTGTTGTTGYGFSGDRDTSFRNTSFNTTGDRDTFNRGSYSGGYATSGNQGGFSTTSGMGHPGNYSSSYTSPSGTYGQSSNYSYNRNY
ncbi:hypothetical protein RvY_12594 [Ramazzottius varieornatus]|uniref:Uncharacterized protein n=1 Tax=Ramazzottius varieornatus TaxID=947166 RepID=A0A1D1VK14_RAMVA|nr:hypothetical protein RvY_12594 [Ramazzottius varieornatus]